MFGGLGLGLGPSSQLGDGGGGTPVGDIPAIDYDRSRADNNNFADVTGFNIPLPATVDEDDLIVVRVKMTGGAGDIIVPAGWTAISATQFANGVAFTTQGRSTVFYRTMDGTEGGSTIATGSGTSGSLEYSYAVITGADTEDPINAWDYEKTISGAKVALEIETSSDNTLILGWPNVFVGGKTFFDPVGFTLMPKWNSDLTYPGGYTSEQADAGTLGPVDFGVTPNSDANIEGWVVAIAPTQ